MSRTNLRAFSDRHDLEEVRPVTDKSDTGSCQITPPWVRRYSRSGIPPKTKWAGRLGLLLPLLLPLKLSVSGAGIVGPSLYEGINPTLYHSNLYPHNIGAWYTRPLNLSLGGRGVEKTRQIRRLLPENHQALSTNMVSRVQWNRQTPSHSQCLLPLPSPFQYIRGLSGVHRYKLPWS